MKTNFSLILLTAFLIIFNASDILARNKNRQPASPNNRISVFLDTQHWFDDDYVRQQIPVVSFVRDKELADVHIIVTRHGAGTAGTNYAISFIGKRAFNGINHEYIYWASNTNSSYETRKGYTHIIKAGLVSYLAATPVINQVLLDFYINADTVANDFTTEVETDPWNNWVFEIYGGGNFSKEERLSNYSFRTGFFADRVTSEWKIRLRPYFNFNNRTFVTSDGDIVSSTHRHGYAAYVVKSITDHWSVGLFSSGLSSTFHNLNFNADLIPAVEWSLFPYDEATRRSVTLAYRLGYGYNNYIETTIFDKDEEWVFAQSLEASFRFQQPWGNFRAGLTGSHFFNDLSMNRAQVFTNLNLRIIQGFSLNFFVNYEIINDLIAVPAGDRTLEEILLARSQQATSYSISGSIGLSYTFGSKFSAAFNPRL